jgi:NADH:ubiquinone oxidoreductase subunit D
LGIEDLRLSGADYDLQAPQPLDLFARVEMGIYKTANSKGVSSLAIEIPEFRADMSIGGVIVGGTSIGSIFVDDLAINNTQMIIYGH